MSKLVEAQNIAARLWFAGGPKKTPYAITNKIPHALEITEAEVRAILESPEYLVAVKHLIMTTRTPKRLKEWIDGWGARLPDHLTNWMGLSSDDASALASDLVHEVHSTIESKP